MIYVDDKAAMAIRRRIKQIGLSQPKVSRMAGRSASWLATQVLPSPSNAIRYLAYKDPQTLNRLLRALQWTPEQFAEATGIELPGVPREPRAEDLGLPVEVYTLPLIQAGAGPPWYQDEAETITMALPELKYPSEKLFVVRIVGDSMTPYLDNGDLAVVYMDPGLAEKGKAVAVWIADDGVVIKRLLGETEDGLLYLGNDNPAYPPFLAPTGSRIVGTVVKRVKEG